MRGGALTGAGPLGALVTADDIGQPSPPATRSWSWLIPPLMAALTLAHHVHWLALNHALPVGDGGSHAMVVGRYLAWLDGHAPVPLESYPPLGHLSMAVAAELLGGGLPAAQLGVAVWIAVMALGASLLGLRLAGRTAAVVAPLVAVGTPWVANIGHDLLLDVPAAAMVPWILLFLWESRGFTRLGPSLGLGVAVAVGVGIKYTFLLWLTPAIALTALVTLIRAPLVLGPVLVSALPAAYVLTRIWARKPPSGQVDFLGLPVDPATGGLTLLLVVGAALTLGARLWWGRRLGRAEAGAEGGSAVPGWQRQLLRGLNLACALSVAFTLTLPWFYAAAPPFLGKLLSEAVEHRRVAGFHAARAFSSMLLWRSWPRSYEWSAIGAGLGLLTAILSLTGVWRWRGIRWLTGDLSGVRGWAALEATAVLVGCAAFGVWLHSQILPTDLRYYFYMPLLLGLLAGIAPCWLRLTRWTLAPALGALCLLQATWLPGRLEAVGLGDIPVAEQVRNSMNLVNSKDFIQLYTPARPLEVDLEGTMAEVSAIIVERAPRVNGRFPCHTVGMIAERTDDLESDGLRGYMGLLGIELCVVFPLDRLLPRRNKPMDRGPSEADMARARKQIITILSVEVGDPREGFEEDVEEALGRGIDRIYYKEVGSYRFRVYAAEPSGEPLYLDPAGLTPGRATPPGMEPPSAPPPPPDIRERGGMPADAPAPPAPDIRDAPAADAPAPPAPDIREALPPAPGAGGAPAPPP